MEISGFTFGLAVITAFGFVMWIGYLWGANIGHVRSHLSGYRQGRKDALTEVMALVDKRHPVPGVSGKEAKAKKESPPKSPNPPPTK
jgi:hypothetical protein